MDQKSRIADLATPAALEAGLVVDSVAVSPAGKRSKVTVILDLPEDAIGSADLDAIAVASRAIGAALDDADVFPGAYVLEVSTPGTDRPLKERRHFMRARTRLVTLDTVNGPASGRVTDVDGDVLVLDTPAGASRIPLADITVGRIEVELKRIATEDAEDGVED